MKSLAKTCCLFLASAMALPLAAGYWLCAAIGGGQRALPGWAQLVSLWPGMTGNYVRRAFYAWVLPECGQNTCLGFGVLLTQPATKIGRGVYVGPYSVLGEVTLEEDVLISSHVSIINGSRQHGIDRLDVPVREQPGEWPRVTIGCDTWIGERAVIAADIGRHCVIGAGAVVTEPIPDYGIAVGMPAKVVRYRNSSAKTPQPLDSEPSPSSAPAAS